MNDQDHPNPAPRRAANTSSPSLPSLVSCYGAPLLRLSQKTAAHRVHGRQERPDVPLLAVVRRPGRQHGVVLHLRRVQVVLVLRGSLVDPLRKNIYIPRRQNRQTARQTRLGSRPRTRKK